MNRRILVLLTFAIAAAGQPAQSGKKALVGGTLIDGYGGPPIRNSVILINNDRIQAVGQVGSLPVPPDAWSAVPFPATVLQYTPGQGIPKDRTQAKADEYYAKVVAKVKALVLNTLHRWEVAGF